MSPSRTPFRGRMEAYGFLLDPAIIGEAETGRRLMRWWTTGAGLYDFEGVFVLTLPEPVSVRAERAPGLPIQGSADSLQVAHAGRMVDLDPHQLRPSDLSRWIDLDQLLSCNLEALGAMPARARALVPAAKAPAPPDLRAATGIGSPNGSLGRGLRRMRQERASPATARAGTVGRRDKQNRFARLTLRTPAARLIGRRHAKYVRKLTASFDNKDWDSALRSAISLGGGEGPLSLRLPTPRGRVLGPGGPRPGGASVPYGPTVHQHLREIYQRAADQLEQAGRFLEAAFVHADLLAQPVAAVELLERHGQSHVAAELAEGWTLEPALVVRLWWRAGNRDRAITIASTRGAFGAAIDRLHKLDPTAALELRRAWMLDRREAGDHIGAVEAAWPAHVLRDDALVDIATGMAAGGFAAGVLLAHLLNHDPAHTKAYELATRLFEDDPDISATRDGFLRTFAKLPATNTIHDRELATTVLLAVIRPDIEVTSREVGDIRRSLKPRADPLVVADLPAPTAHPPDITGSTLEIDALLGGQIELHDVVALGPRTVMLALGELGARLITHDGRTRARWDIPTHRLVVSDHGNRVLLVGDRGSGTTLHQLDLPNGRPTALPSLPAPTYLLDTYDGSRPVTISHDGIRWLTATNDRWRVVWEELTDGKAAIWQVARTPEKLTALFADPVPNVWQWDLPEILLRQRSTHLEDGALTVLADGHIGRLRHTSPGNRHLTWTTAWKATTSDMTLGSSTSDEVRVFGTGFVLTEPHEDHAVLHVTLGAGQPPLARTKVPAGSPFVVRRFRNYLTLAHHGGRVVVIDTTTSKVVCNFRTRP